MRKYYEAYDDRYCQVHARQLQWASDVPSDIVMQTLMRFVIPTHGHILELGCGEGRDAAQLLRKGYNLTATDISREAIRYCRTKYPEFSGHFQRLDFVAGEWNGKFDFIYAVAVVHMLVEDEDRKKFYDFIGNHLKEDAVALICTMGDGTMERKSDILGAFELQERTHGETGEKLLLAGTSCRMVSRENFLGEIEKSGLSVLEYGLTAVEPDFPVMMYAIVKKC